jgi:hypothetical protein
MSDNQKALDALKTLTFIYQIEDNNMFLEKIRAALTKENNVCVCKLRLNNQRRRLK